MLQRPNKLVNINKLYIIFKYIITKLNLALSVDMTCTIRYNCIVKIRWYASRFLTKCAKVLKACTINTNDMADYMIICAVVTYKIC